MAQSCIKNERPANIETSFAVRGPDFKRGPGRPIANWKSLVGSDSQKMGLTWEEAEAVWLAAWLSG